MQPPATSDTNALSHDAAGLVSVKRGSHKSISNPTPHSPPAGGGPLEQLRTLTLPSRLTAHNFPHHKNHPHHNERWPITTSYLYNTLPQGGGSFELTLTPRASPDLDQDNIVIGQVCLWVSDAAAS